MRHIRVMVVVASLLLSAGIASAQALVPRVPADAQKDLPPLVCRQQTVQVEIDNQVARVRVEQVFINNTGADLECVYFLPLHESASISRFSYWVKGNEIVGRVKEREEARQTYEALVGRRRDPALLEYAGRNLFRASIFPVSPTEPMGVVVEYSQICDYENGKVTFSYPLTAGGQEQKIEQFAFSATVRDQKPIKRVSAPSYGNVDTALVNANSARVSWERASFTPERDFQVVYELQSRDFGVSFLTHREAGQDGYFMLMVAPQEETTAADIVKKDMVFVFDRSGSMDGEKIQQARAALRFCLRNLGDQDRFGLVTFDDEISPYADRLQDASKANISAALKAVDALEARGSTDINGALLAGLKLFQPGTRQKTLIFLTDGLPTAGEQQIGQIVKNVKAANRRDVRIFTFGVGDDVDDYLLLKLATDNHGATQAVRGGQSIEGAISTFYAKVAQPVLVDLKLSFGPIRTSRVYPEVLPDIFKGRQLIVLGRYQSTGPADLVLTGQTNGRDRKLTYPTTFPETEPGNAFLERLWAKARVDWAIDSMRLNGENQELKDEVIALSKQFMFITPYTSFLAVSQEELGRLEAERAALAGGTAAAPSAAAYPAGGDPSIRVSAPAATRRVVALFPWGQSLPLVPNPATGLWECRFIVPKTVAHGDYQVVLVVTRADGSRSRLVVSFQVDREEPGGSGMSQVTRTARGWQVTLWVGASEDASRATALLPDGRSLEMERDDATGRWQTTFDLPAGAGPSLKVPVVVYDRGHNWLQIEVEVELR